MIAGLKAYPVMKDSGAPWLGEIPERWQMRRLKYLLRERDERSPDGQEQLLRVSQFTGVTERKHADGGDEPDTRAASLVGYKNVEVDDLVINIMLAWNGSMGVSPFAGIASPAYGVYRFGAEAQPWFFHHLLRSPIYKARIKAVSTGVVESRLRLYTDALYRLKAVVPPKDEQAAIVRFLDHADRRIRRYIRAKQKLIKLLEEQKQAIIHRAVTRGLDPDVRLKPSGVEWLGDVPEHWEVFQVRRLVSFVTSGSRGWADFYTDTGDIFLQSGNLGRTMALDLSKVQHVQPPSGSEGERTLVEHDDVLVCITGALTGNVVIVDVDLAAPAFVNQHIGLLRPKQTVIFPRYLALALHSEIGRIQFKTSEYGGTKQGLGLDDLKSAVLPVPPISEQIEICEEVQAQVETLALITNAAQLEITLLREYRTCLIADVVTGKLDVREAAAQLPDESDEPETPDDAEGEGDADMDVTDDLGIEAEA